MPVDPRLVERFGSKYAIDKATGCWNWTASVAGKGYGQIKIPGTRKQMSRIHRRLRWKHV